MNVGSPVVNPMYPLMDDAQFARVQAAVARREKRPAIIPPQLRGVEALNDGYRGRFAHLLFIVSEAKEDDGKWWRHASVSRRDRQTPSYDDLKTLHRITMPAVVAYQLFVPEDQHIDFERKGGVPVLHLWGCVDGPVTPDFSSGTGSI